METKKRLITAIYDAETIDDLYILSDQIGKNEHDLWEILDGELCRMMPTIDAYTWAISRIDKE